MKWIRIFFNSPANPSYVRAIRLIRHVFCHVIHCLIWLPPELYEEGWYSGKSLAFLFFWDVVRQDNSFAILGLFIVFPLTSLLSDLVLFFAQLLSAAAIFSLDVFPFHLTGTYYWYGFFSIFRKLLSKNALCVSILLDQLPLLSLFCAGDSIKKWVWYHDPDFLLLILGLHYYYFMKARMVLLRSKKSSLDSINRPGENFFNHPPAHIVECVSSEYIFLI